ncbi:MAG: 2-oxo acid dehydrogenase subunit E2 [Acidobacteriota bacterium]|nr:2-oxo acid dehydrogenase subunit E2 [Acidobacteriota bacterium]
MRKVKTKAVRKLDHSERWFRDGIALCQPPAFSQSLEVDVSRVQELIARARERGLHLTYVHVLVRAVALVLSANPGMHVMVCGRKIHCPTEVDIALSVNAETSVAPVLVIESASRKSLAAIADEVIRRVPVVQAQHEKMLAVLKRWGRAVPLSFMRRGLLRFLYRFFEFRRKGSGTFQVSIMSGADTFTTSMFNTCGILTAGKVRDRVIAADGVPLVRPTVHLTCSADHRVWNGGDCQKFLLAVQEMLMNGSLDCEI